MPDLATLRADFIARFGGVPSFFTAPGRVNLIGEHTDYNEGFVMPAAIGLFTTVAAAERGDGNFRVRSTNFQETVEFHVDRLASPRPEQRGRHWSDYVVGVARALHLHGVALRGADILIHGEVPLGAGLGSSASLELATALALTRTAHATIDPQSLARICHRAENEYVGTRCGIMDQFASACGSAGNALLLDCRSLECRLLPLEAPLRAPDGCIIRLVVCNTMVRRQLAAGEYNRRREECELGVRHLVRLGADVNTLRDVTPEILLAHQRGMDDVIYRRCRHVVLENVRVIAAARALADANLAVFGEHMRASHLSLQQDYEVSCEELDLMVHLASEVDGVHGARMMGGGFGGCTINLVRDDAVERFRAVVAERYSTVTARRPDIYVCESADGAAPVPAE